MINFPSFAIRWESKSKARKGGEEVDSGLFESKTDQRVNEALELIEVTAYELLVDLLMNGDKDSIALAGQVAEMMKAVHLI